MYNLKKIKRLIILFCIFIIIIITVIIAIKIKQKEEIDKAIEKEIIEAETVTKQEIIKEEGIYMYIDLNRTINNMFSYISKEEDNIDNEKIIMGILDKEYITKNNLTEENVLEYFSNYKDINSYSTKEIFVEEVTQAQNISCKYLYIKGIIRKKGIQEKIYIIIKQDLYNSTYSMQFLKEEEFNNIWEKNKEVDFHIEDNGYNTIRNVGIDKYQICMEYFNDYLNTIKNNVTDGYNLLDETYREKRFANVEEYKEYISLIKDNIDTAVLKKYSIESIDGETQYICQDQRENYYIFKVKSTMQYKVILDTFTIDLPQFIKKYNSAVSVEKVGYNIQKCIEAINNKEYGYVYNKLDESFKKQYYSTEEKFINEIKKKLYNVNTVSNVTSSNEGDIYIYNITIMNKDDSSKKQDMTVIMQLKEGTDFVMSFSFK